MEIPKITDIQYDNYYKFLTSFTLVTLLASFAGAYMLTTSFAFYPESTVQSGVLVAWLIIFAVAALCSVIVFIVAVKKWKEYQDKIDEANIAETELKKEEVKLKKAEHRYKVAEVDKLIRELAKQEPIILTPSDQLEAVRIARVEGRIDRKTK